MHYNRLIALVFGLNLALLGYCVSHGKGFVTWSMTPAHLALIAQANLCGAVLIRQQYVVNVLCWLATRAPTSWPLRIRWALSKVYHFGGLHVGFAICGTLWYAVFACAMTFPHAAQRIAAPNLALSFGVLALLLSMIIMATPCIRARFHDLFEATHRFCGWGVVFLSWANMVAMGNAQKGQRSLIGALLGSPAVWMLLVTTASGAVAWLRLRRVPIRVDRPSSHVAVVRLDHSATPFVGSTRAISRSPLFGWHSFASIPTATRPQVGYRMVVSRAGDWTSEFIDNPPSHVWVRGIPVAGMANVRKLFQRVVYIATGSGIGPMVSHLTVNEVPGHLVWVTRSPRQTYGDALVDEILAAQPEATIWNTDVHGKPDMLQLAYAAYTATGAEAVICVSNKQVTWQIVHGLESLGIPACGPIWDS